MPKPKPRPRPQVMRLTDAAAQRIKRADRSAPIPIVGVRVGVKNGGCAGMSYTMEYADERQARPTRWSRTRASRSWSIPRRCCSCSAPRWTTRPTSCRRSSCSTTRTRPRPAAAASRCSPLSSGKGSAPFQLPDQERQAHAEFVLADAGAALTSPTAGWARAGAGGGAARALRSARQGCEGGARRLESEKPKAQAEAMRVNRVRRPSRRSRRRIPGSASQITRLRPLRLAA
jgi:hypothetical protein